MASEHNGNNNETEPMPAKKHKTGFRGPSPDVGKATQIKKGEVRNPHGRPPGIISAALCRRLAKSKGAELEAVVKAIVDSAKKGNSKAFTAIRDTVDGRPIQAIDVSGQVEVSGSIVARLIEGRQRVVAITDGDTSAAS